MLGSVSVSAYHWPLDGINICQMTVYAFWQVHVYIFYIQSKKISNDQELIQSDPISCPQNQKGNNLIHKLTTVYERHSQQTEWTALSQIGGHSAT